MSSSERPYPSLSGIDWRWALPRLALVFAVTRLLAVGVAALAEWTHPATAELLRVDDRPILSSLTLWDGQFYIGIAADGYHADPSYGPDYAFYPGFPVLVRLVSLLTLGDLPLAAVLAANLAFAAALVVLYVLSLHYLSPDRAILSLWFLTLAPGSIALALSYTEALFLLLSAAAFLAAERRHYVWAGVLLALLTLTRVQGILLILPIWWLIVSREGWRPSRAWLPLVIAPALVLAWLAWLWWLTGDPLAPMSAQDFWNPEADVTVAGEGGVDVAEHRMGFADTGVLALWIGSIAFYCFLFVFFRHDRIRPAYWLLSILTVAAVFLSGSLQSAPRYLAMAWPFAWVLANRQSRLGRGLVLAVFVTLHVSLLWLAFTWRVPP